MSDDINVPEAKKDECKEKLEHAKDRFTSANARLLHRMTVAEEHKDALIDETLLSMVPARPPALAHAHTHTITITITITIAITITITHGVVARVGYGTCENVCFGSRG